MNQQIHEQSESTHIGQVIWVNGPVVRARGSVNVGMMELVEIGENHLIGEVIGLNHDVFTIQVYEETTGLQPGAPVFSTGTPLSVELGPGLLGSIFDGIQRPLPVLQKRSGAFIGRGIKTTPLYHKQPWEFSPKVTAGDTVTAGSILGVVQETPLIEHRIMVPSNLSGTLTWVAPAGTYTVVDPIARLKNARGEHDITMLQRWPVRQARPYKERLVPNTLLTTGQRVLDTLFPLAKGGTAAIPGGFGAGKTITQQAIARWSDCDIIIYIGCGERGNEMTQVLQEFPSLIDPHSKRSLMERTILVANTSNMPVAAREASIYTGVTLAEYYRDMGYAVAMMADSTSRWAEALREISGRLEEMPAEEGYPAYLAARLASFYERAGRVTALSGREGSISIIGAVSPPSNDFSEPVTQHTKRFVRCFWALDKTLAGARHFPSVNWLDSYSEYIDYVTGWWSTHGYPEWRKLRSTTMELLQRESKLQQIVKLVGPDALPDNQRLVLETARLLREGYLQQNALDDIDAYAVIEKQMAMLKAILNFHEHAQAIVANGCPIHLIRALPALSDIVRMKYTVPNDQLGQIDAITAELNKQLDELAAKYEKPAAKVEG